MPRARNARRRLPALGRAANGIRMLRLRASVVRHRDRLREMMEGTAGKVAAGSADRTVGSLGPVIIGHDAGVQLRRDSVKRRARAEARWAARLVVKTEEDGLGHPV